MTDQHPAPQEDEINLLDYVIVVLKHKEFIIKTTLAAMALAAVVSLVIPPTYQAETKILPPSGGGSSMASLMMAQMGGFSSLASSALGVKNPEDLYISLLKTRPVEDYVIDKFNLMKRYQTQSHTVARAKLRMNLSIGDDIKSGIISVGFKDRSPQMAADIANAYIEGLQNLNNNLAISDASQRRLFFEQQLKNAKEMLIASEDALRSFQQRTGTIKLDEEAAAAAGTIAQMRAQVTAKEVQISAMRAYATPDNPDLQRLQDEAAALRGELAKIESRNRGGDGDGPLSSVGNISSLGTEYLRRMRDFKYNESLYEILLKQFEAAKLDESRNAALVQIVDKATPPEFRYEPKRGKIVFSTGVIVCLLSTILVIGWRFLGSPKQVTDLSPDLQAIVENLSLTSLMHDFRLDIVWNKLRLFK